MILLRPLIEVQDLVILAEAIAVKIAIRVVEDDALGIKVGKSPTALDCLSECGRVLERKALFTQCVAKAHPRALFAAARTAVTFVNQHQVVPLEGVDGDGL